MANGDGTNPKIVGILMGLLGVTVGFVPSYFLANTGLQVVKGEIRSLNEKLEDNYRSPDAFRDHELIRERDAAMQKAITENAGQIKELEALIRDHVTERGIHN